MKFSQKTASILLTIFFLLALIYINHDIFRFEYHDPTVREFSQDEDAKGFYFLGDPVTLKPGQYQLVLNGDLPRKGSSIDFMGNGDEILLGLGLEPFSGQTMLDFTISDRAQNVRIRLNYDPISGPLQIKHLTVSCDHVLYRTSVITHGITSLVCTAVYLMLLMRIWKPGLVFRVIPFLSDSRNETAFWIIILLTLMVNIPMLLPGKYLNGMDTLFHYSRIKGVAADLQAGIFPPRVELFWLDNIGYGVGLFYPEIFLVIPAVFLLIGFQIYDISRFLWIITIFITLLTHYRTAKKISGGSQIAGISSAIFIAFSIYRIQNQFMRDGLGETFAFIFMPLIVEGFYLIFNRKSGGKKLLVLGFTGVLLNHLLSFVIAVVITAIFLVTQIRKILHDRDIFLDILKAALFSIGIGAFFLFPLLEQKFAVPDLKINQIVSGTFQGDYSHTIHSVKSLLTLYRPEHVGTFYPGWALLLVPLMGLWLWKCGEKELHAPNVMAAAGILVMAASTEIFPWHWFRSFLYDIQYTWRLMQSGTVLLSLAGGIYIARLCSRYSRKAVFALQLLLCILPAIPVIISLCGIYIQKTDDFFMLNNHIGQGEYLQGNVMRKYVQDNTGIIKDLTNDTVSGEFVRRGLSLTFEYSHDGEEINFIVPFLYYKGYTAEIQSGNGSSGNAFVSAAEDGFVQIRGTGSASGRIRTEYKGTLIQTVSSIITLLTIIGLSLRNGYNRVKYR